MVKGPLSIELWKGPVFGDLPSWEEELFVARGNMTRLREMLRMVVCVFGVEPCTPAS